MKHLWLIGILLAAAAPQARADQCGLAEPKQADAAAKYLRGSTVIQYCEMCKDDTVGEPTPVKSLEQSPVSMNGERWFETRVNGEAIDLAYTYVLVGDRYVNLGMLTGCGVGGVSATLKIEHLAGNRVVITPAHDELTLPEPAPPPPAPAPVAAIPAAAPAAPATIVMQTGPEYFDLWATSALAALACGGAIGVTLALVVTRRRRLAMQPRAEKLIARD